MERENNAPNKAGIRIIIGALILRKWNRNIEKSNRIVSIIVKFISVLICLALPAETSGAPK
jgi:hypothetical protein